MYVNKIHLLPRPVLRQSSLRNELIRCCLITRRNISDSALARFLGCLPTSVTNSRLCSRSKPNFLNQTKRHLSRYCASTIMRPHTKAFSFKDYDVIGFDLDGTALRYNLTEMVPLEYELLSQYLVRQKGYSCKVLRSLDSDCKIDFLQKGLFLDTARGNILKLNNDGCILKANHGTRTMSDKEITETYGERRMWSVTQQFIENPLCAWNGPLAEEMRSLLDYFDMSACLVFAHAVDDVDSRRQRSNMNQPYEVWPDILEALIHIYTRDNFCNGESEYFSKLRNEPDRFLLKTSPIVINWLKGLRASNKILFLLTGSHIDFANFTASYAMGENWRDLFDVVICFARKPGFFHASRPFYKLDGFKETESIPIDGELQMNSVYSMGNWQQLLKLFGSCIGKDPSKVKSVYVGDNLIQDVFAPAALAEIDSVAISEEMLAENSDDNSNNPDIFEFRDVVASNYWNSYFFVDGEPTLWTNVINKYSKMCLPTLEHAAVKPIDYEFLMCNKHGFYPTAPAVERNSN